MQKVHSVEEYILNHEQWQDELIFFYELITSQGFDVAIKWNTPVFIWGKKNVVGLGAFKKHVALWFYQGALLTDHKKVLISTANDPGQAMRQYRVASIKEIDAGLIVDFLQQSIENIRQGKAIKPNMNRPIIIPEALRLELKEDFELSLAFNKLTKTRKREFCHYISQAKREDTVQRRLKKIIPMIMEGRGYYS
jgi:uncharacterized protein YdeI (YjbR/CyaY-like superfamily)